MNYDLFGPIVQHTSSRNGRALRDEGIAATLEAEREAWRLEATTRLKAYAIQGREFTCEEFRSFWLALGRPEPHSHHVWGALFMACARAGIIKQIGYRKAESAKTHAHPVGVWTAP